MKYKPITEWIGCGISSLFTMLQTNENWQLVCLILTCVSITITTAFTIYKWYKSAMADGKITKEEIEEGIEIAAHGIDQIGNAIKEKEDGSNKK